MQNKSMKIVGIMSGTSLDGLDLALCEFKRIDRHVTFDLLAAQTFEYTNEWKERLQTIFNSSAQNYFNLHSNYGAFIGKNVNNFLTKHHQTADAIASHGHTIFHQPQYGFTTQIGCGASIAALTGITTACDFRSIDVSLSGQGAPLVPIGDRDLFFNYEACLNIGGIANISFTKNHQTSAFDICIANMALNYLSETIGLAYDNGGEMASKGSCNQNLLQSLLELKTKQQSLGREWFEKYFLPILISSSVALNDKLNTCVEYLAIQINECLQMNQIQSVLLTGGGAYNTFFRTIKKLYNGKVEIPSDDVIQFKEAIIFAYLGYLRLNEQINTLSSVTKANRNSIGGAVYLGNI